MNKINSLSLNAKLGAVIAATVVALAVLFAVILQTEKSLLLKDRQEKVRNLVEVAYSVAAHYEQLSRDGKLSTDEAKTAALAALRSLRYDQVEYFWVNDMTPVVVMHPIKPELDGKDVSGMKDPFGKALFVEFTKTVKASGSGFVGYYWPKPGSDEPVEKLSYVKGFAPWGWVIGSGIYLDDVDAIFRQEAKKFLAWAVGIGGLITLGLVLVSRYLVHLLGGEPHYAAEIARRIAAGDLTTEVKCRAGDKTSLLAGMKDMQETLHTMIGEIVQNAQQLSSAAELLLTSSDAIASRSQQQSDAASSMAAAVEEMTVSIDQIAENTREAHGLAVQAGDESEKGTSVIHGAGSEMRKLSEAVQDSARIIEELGRQSDQITSIVNTIKEIADQTNLLALNAAIEAARAGEQGRGFSVVADEVRKLAERTAVSTTEIAGMVSQIQKGTQNAVGSMEAGVAQAGKGVELADEAGRSILQIRDGARRVTEVVNDITHSIKEQSIASNDIAKGVERIAQMAEESALAVQDTAHAAHHLQELSSALHVAVTRFRTT